MKSLPAWHPDVRNDLIWTLSIRRYLESLRFSPYAWQRDVIESRSTRKIISGARRAGKSQIIAAKPCHRARFFPRSVALILGATQTQAVEDMRLVRNFIAVDPAYPQIIRASDEQLELENRSRVIVVPATEVSARGYPDADLIIVDEGAYIANAIYVDCLIPMLNGNDHCELIIISSPNGKAGDPGKFFHDAFHDEAFERFEVRAPWEIDGEDRFALRPAGPEASYQAERAKEGVRAYYSPRHTNLEEQLFALSKQGPLKYAQNQLSMFVEPEEQVIGNAEIKHVFRPRQDRNTVVSRRLTPPKRLVFADD